MGSSEITRVKTAIHLCCACGTCLAFTPRDCWQCRILPCHQGEPSFEKYIVPGASYPIVTNHACPGRQLLVAQQVTASTSSIAMLNVTRQKRALPSVTACRFTLGGRRHVSHYGSLNRGRRRSNASLLPDSLVESAKANGIDPYRYLTWLFQRLPLAKTVDDYDALLPWKLPAHLR